jgi:large subunit ribosomal protein L24
VQTTLLSLAIALILALLAALIGPYFVDWNQYRPVFEAQSSRLVGLPVRIGGKIDVRLLPSPSLLLSGIEIGSHGRDRPLRARALGIELALGSLMRGQLRATELRLVAPEVALELGADGRLGMPNIGSGLNVSDISIAKLSIEDARLLLADAASGRRIALDKLWFGGEVRSLGGVFKGDGAFVLDGRLYGYRISSFRTEEGDARVKLNLEPSDARVTADAEGMLSLAQGVPRFEGGLTLVRLAGVAMAGSAAQLQEPWRVASRVTVTPASALFEQLEFQYGPDERAIKLSGAAEFGFGARPHIEAVLSGRQVDLDRALASPDQPRRAPLATVTALIAGLGDFVRPTLPVQIGFGIDGVTLGGSAVQSLRGDLIADLDGWSLKNMEMRAPGFTQVQASGRIGASAGTPSFAGPVAISSVDPRAFASWLEGGNETSAGAAAPLRGRGELSFDDRAIAIDHLMLEIDRKPVTGRLSYRRGSEGANARVEAHLKAQDADIDAMISLARAVMKDRKFEWPEEISLALDMDRARLAGLDVRRAHIKAVLASDGLQIERLAVGDLGGMEVEAEGAVEAVFSAPRGRLTARLQAEDLSGLAPLVSSFAPQWVEPARQVQRRVGSADLNARLEVGAGPRSEIASRAHLDVIGKLGSTRVALKSQIDGSLADWQAAQVEIEANIDGDDAASTLRMLGLERALLGDGGSANVRVSARGPLNGDLRISGRASGSNLEAQTEGRLRLFGAQGVHGAFDVSVAKADIGAVLPQPQTLPMALTARAEFSGRAIKLDRISAQIAGAKLDGSVGLTLGTVTGVTGNIGIDRLDAAALAAVTAGISRKHATSPEEPFDNGLFAQADGSITFRAAAVGAGEGLVLNNVDGILQLSPSRISIDIADAAFAGGRLSGRLALSHVQESRSVAMHLSLKSADAAQLSAGAWTMSPRGRVSVHVEVDGAGRSPEAMLGSLNGAGSLTLNDIKVGGLDPSVFVATTRAVDQGLPLDTLRVRDFVATALQRGELALRNVDAPFTLSAGHIRLATLPARTDGADFAATAVLSLPDRTIDARIVLTGPADETITARPQIAMQFKGPLASPTRSIDAAALTGWLALRAVEQQAKKLEAIERAGAPPVTHSLPSPAIAPASPALPDRPPVMPRTRPQAGVTTPMAAPLPPPIDIRPAPGFGPAQGEGRPRLPTRPPAPTASPAPRGSGF